MTDFTTVIPAYNEAKTIRDIAQRALLHSKNVIIVDDGSTDNTIKQIQDLPVKLLKHTQNKVEARF